MRRSLAETARHLVLPAIFIAVIIALRVVLTGDSQRSGAGEGTPAKLLVPPAYADVPCKAGGELCSSSTECCGGVCSSIGVCCAFQLNFDGCCDPGEEGGASACLDCAVCDVGAIM